MALASTRDTTPVILTTGSTPLAIIVAGGIPGPAVNLPTRDLTNTLRVPIEVTELHFVVDEPPLGTLVTGGIIYDGFEINLSIGRHSITQGFCPLIALGLRRDSDRSEGVNISPIFANTIRWVLPTPLLVAPNESFNGSIRLSPILSPYGANGTVHLSMAARARRLPPGTPVAGPRAVPYASGFIFTIANRPPPDSTFQNPFNRVLHVTSINANPIANDFDSVPGRITVNSPGGLSNTVLRGMVNGGLAGAVFAQRQALEEAHDLNPREAHQVTLSDPTDAGDTHGTAVALIGWREE